MVFTTLDMLFIENNIYKIYNNMGRPLGSKNKPKTITTQNKGLSLRVLNFEKQFQNAPVIKVNSIDNHMKWGKDDRYPYNLISLYNASVTHKACIDFATKAIIGNGVDKSILPEDFASPNYQESWDSFIRKLAFDFSLFGAFSFQVIRSRDGNQYTFYHQSVDSVRLEEMDEDGVSNFAFLCKDWTATGTNPVIKMPLFGFQEEEEIPIGEPHLFYYRTPNPISPYYPIPRYAAAIQAIQSEIEFEKFDLKSIVNSFTPAGALTLPSVDSDEERQAIIDSIDKMFIGSDNANKILITFRTNLEDKPIEFTPFSQASNNVDLYESSNERTISRICVAHGITNRSLIGYASDDSGFSDSGNLMQEAFNVYNTLIANNDRRELLDVINSMFRLNGIEDVEITLLPLKFVEDDVPQQPVSDEEGEEDTSTETTAVEREDDTM